jgi:hypothetical protein
VQSVLGRHHTSSKEDAEGSSPLETQQAESSGRSSASLHTEHKCVPGSKKNYIAKA